MEQQLGWTEASRLDISSQVERAVQVPSNTTYVCIDSDAEVSIKFDGAAADSIGNNSIRIAAKNPDPIRIPSKIGQTNDGVIFLHVKQTASAANQYCRIVWQ